MLNYNFADFPRKMMEGPVSLDVSIATSVNFIFSDIRPRNRLGIRVQR